MKPHQLARGDGRFVRRYEYDDAVVIVVDLNDFGATVDVVDDTAIVVGSDGDQFDLDLPADRDAQAFINNGVVTIEGEE
jgi:hypothetical protein